MKGWQELKKNKDKGVSMAVVLCISAFFIAFSVAMVYTAGLLTSQANSKVEQKRREVLAESFSEVLDKQLETTSEDGKKAPVKKDDGSYNDSTFFGMAVQFLENSRDYLEYNSQYPDKTTYYYKADSSEKTKNYGDAIIGLRKEKDKDEEVDQEETTLEIGTDNNKINGMMTQTVHTQPYTLYVDATVESGNDKYTYTTEYTYEKIYEVKFYHNKQELQWKENGWYISGSSTALADGTKITCKMEWTKCKFINTGKQEEGDSN